MNIVMYISSVTGNTQRVAETLAERLSHEHHLTICDPIHFRDLSPGDFSFGNQISGQESDLAQPDLVLLCFWCRKGSLDDRSRRTLAGLSGQKILAFGTMGFYPDSEYGEMVRQNVADLINDHNTCLGVFTCQGKIPEERTEKRRALPHDHKHWLDDEGYARHLETRKHPSEQDLADALHFLQARLG